MADDPSRRAVPVQERLRDQVAHALRSALIAGELRPGAVYSAPTLAARFGVSATPVREAMLDLAREGMVEVVRNKGFRVTELTERDLDEFTELRALIEIPTVLRVTATAVPEQLQALRPAAEEIVAAARARDLVGYLEADRRFHLDLLALAGNDHLVKVVGELRRRSRRFGLTGPDPTGELVDAAQEHIELLDLMVMRDAEAVGELMRRHLTHARSLGAARQEEAARRSPPGPADRGPVSTR